MFGGTALIDPGQPHRLTLTLGTLVGVDPANKDAVREALIGGYGDVVSSNGRAVATWDVPDDVPTWLECRLWLEAGQFPRFSFPNGPTNSNFRITGFVRENKYTLLDKKQLAAYESANQGGDWGHLLFFETPRIRLHKAEVKGPLNEQWPPPGHRAVFGAAPYAAADAVGVLRTFAARAWCRPVNDADVGPILKLVCGAEKAALNSEAPPQKAAADAMTQGVRAVICAPEFLYREERSPLLDGHEIASRLSYFLWSSLPDEELRVQAGTGALNRPEVRRQEAERLLSDARSDTFIREFLDGWLALRKLGSMKPQEGGSLDSIPLAQKLARGWGELRLGLTELLPGIAAELSKHRGNEEDRTRPGVVARRADGSASILRLDNICALAPETAEALAAHEGVLVLNALTTLPPAVAASQAKRTGNSKTGRSGVLVLNGLETLSTESAAALAAFTGELVLKALPELTPETAAALSKHRGRLHLTGLRRLTPECHETLKTHPNLLLPRPLPLTTAQ